MLPHWTTLGFSGHRDLERADVAVTGIRRALDLLTAKCGSLSGLSSAASGGDMLFLEEMVRRKLPFAVLLPFARERFKGDFTPEAWRSTSSILDQATSVEELAPITSDKEAYYETGALTVERSDVMLFLWDGKEAAGVGGTGDMVIYARALDKPLIIINPHTGELREERLERLQSSPRGEGQSPGPRESVQNRFAELNDSAKRHAPQVRRLVYWIIFLHLFASAIGIGALIVIASLPGDSKTEHMVSVVSLSAEFVILIVAFGLALLIRHAHHVWMHSRLGAELCRSALALANMRRIPGLWPQIHFAELAQLSHTLEINWHLDRASARDLGTARADYLKNRVEDQIAYYDRSAKAAGNRFKIFRTIAQAATVISLVCVTSALSLSFGNEPHGIGYKLLKLFSLLLPLINAAALSLVISQEYSRRSIRYAEMLRELYRRRKQIEEIKSWPTLVRAIKETEEALLSEVVEWHAHQRFAADSH